MADVEYLEDKEFWPEPAPCLIDQFVVVFSERMSHASSWKLYEIVAEGDDGPMFSEKGDESMKFTEQISLAQPTAEGFVKWDGCFEITIEENHFCGAKSWERFAAAIRGVFDKAALVIEPWDHQCADTVKP